MSSDEFDVVIEAMLEAPYKKENNKFRAKVYNNTKSSSRCGGAELQTLSHLSLPAPSSESREATDSRSQSHEDSSSTSHERKYARAHHRRRRSHERRRRHSHGKSRHSRRGHHSHSRGHRSSHRGSQRYRRSPSRSRSPLYRDRSFSRDQTSKRTPEERDACTVLCLQFSGHIRPRDLADFFRPAGKVRDVKIISDRSSRRSKGIAYVEFYEMDSVALAINLSGSRLFGIPIIVQASQAEKNRTSALVSGQQKGQAGPTRLYVGSLHSNITEEMLRGIFQPFGKIDSLHVIKDTESGISRGYAFVTFSESESAQRALEQLHGFELAGRPLKVGLASDRSEMEGPISFMDNDEADRAGISLGPTGRLHLMARLAKGSGIEIPFATQAALQLTSSFAFGGPRATITEDTSTSE
ncbi:RNA-binding protein 39-like isoform X2 [Scyliorhinus canicula]|uniref:RNA-binding protein 39-like isoform X2 n=1 Tax=Scyliorhinus canicula TaxID=7830 RepID=UPI0018F66A4A|nr:RNA-binding protein 39-like isoform X2 [Scyliorhinus canicula]